MAAWTALSARIRELDALAGASSVLEWDQQTQAPPKSADSRGEQSALLQRIYHERFTAPEVGGWLSELEGGALDATQAASVRLLRRKYDRAVGIPTKLVEALAVARSEGFHAWVAAKAADDFTSFAPKLQRLLDLTREQAAALGAARCAHPYDALLEEYDPGSTVGELRPMFERLGTELGTFLTAVESRPHPAAFEPKLDVEGQRRLSERVLRDLGFDMLGGRLDKSAHPFSIGLGPGDVRLTTRFMEDNFLSGLGSTIHECGHGMYEQGLPNSLAGTGLNQAAGMGLHESQSRFWENFIGRSLPFFRYLAPRMGAIWPTHDFAPEQMFGAANRVQRSLVRVEADEATYNLHIIVRFGLEVAVMEGQLQATDLPGAWDEAYRRTVGVTAPSAKEGVLQDVHWSSGLLGYFPSYTIGNLYAASFSQCMLADLPDLWEHVERGHFAPILGWLRTRVHERGHIMDAPDLFREVAGSRDPVEDLMSHLWSRHGELYGVARPR
ncbi:carboxypeptidase M32 [Deltaproteobacteria bacterium]|nr:carboxypeptidase M32 [Deltaproteobacteria bacterium]